MNGPSTKPSNGRECHCVIVKYLPNFQGKDKMFYNILQNTISEKHFQV